MKLGIGHRKLIISVETTQVGAAGLTAEATGRENERFARESAHQGREPRWDVVALMLGPK